ncbi:hypothetical protein [Halopseudomonas bauzanensis]|uniref:Cytochrome oxidase assembly protein n=1 Tax=Halopseudomonas bauzanensis TaxID=653930 RepID=A0A4U0YKU4_9GAMM|nr:hypothetical protein [Halopseudomonas bauzanensis]TKA92780.1 hypothetical protein FA869_00900 [Halopseudomonas bauzanensis]
MSMTEQAPDTRRPRGQLKLLAIIAVVLGPILAAWLMATTGVGIPHTQTNHSALVEPQLTVQDWQLELDQVGYGAPWRLLVTAPGECTEACLALVHEARQINVATGREADRVEHVLALGQAVSAELNAQLARDYPQLQQIPLSPAAYRDSLSAHPEAWQQGPQLWVVDPLGRVVLHRDPANPGKALLEDLRHLLKVSKVG